MKRESLRHIPDRKPGGAACPPRPNSQGDNDWKCVELSFQRTTFRECDPAFVTGFGQGGGAPRGSTINLIANPRNETPGLQSR